MSPAAGPGAARRGMSLWLLLEAAGLPLVECLLGLAAVAVAGATLGSFYDGLAWLPWSVAAVVLGGGVAGAALLRGRQWWTATLAVAVVLLVLAHTAGYRSLGWHGLPTPGSLRAFGGGLTTGFPKMLAVGLPANFDGDLVVLPVLVLGAAGAATVAVVLRTRRITPAALPAILVFVLCLALVAARGGRHLVLTGALVLVLLTLLLLRNNRLSVAEGEGIDPADADAVGLDLVARRRSSTYGRVVLGLPFVAVITALALVVAWWLPIAQGTDRRDPRSLYRPPFQISSVLSPLVEVRPQLLQPERPLFTVTVRDDLSPPLDRVRVAALDQFDGSLWTRSKDFQVTGTTLPGAEPLGPGAVAVRLSVHVEHLPQPFLPVTGDPVRFDGEDFAFDRTTGTVVSTRQVVAGFGYSTTAETRPLDRALLEAAPSREPGDRAYTVLPDEPPWVPTLLAKVTRERTTTMTRLLAIETYLRAHEYSRHAPPGHSYGALYRVLLDPKQAGVGSAEQFAAAFAVLARAADIPARVAVGYRLRPQERHGDVYTVTTRDAHAWPEVHLAGYGWVPFEPTPPTEVPLPPRQSDVTLAAADAARVGGPSGPPGQGRVAPVAAGPLSGAGGWGALAGGVVVILLGGVVLAKQVRRRWRAGHGTPAQRLVGAWREVVDRLIEAGVPVPASRTGRELARDLGGGPAAPVSRHVADLAPLVAGAVFGVEEPEESVVQRAWALEARVRRELAASLPLLVRLRALLDPRPLVPRIARRRGTGSRPRWSRGREPVGTR